MGASGRSSRSGGVTAMSDLSIDFAGIKSPNPFWLASAPPANTGDQVMRAFDLGWGGAVWKTLGDPIIDTSSRFGSLDVNGTKMVGFNNIELITDRRSEEHTSELQSLAYLVCRLLLEKKKEALSLSMAQADERLAEKYKHTRGPAGEEALRSQQRGKQEIGRAHIWNAITNSFRMPDYA